MASVYLEDVILLQDDFGWDLEIDGPSAAALFLQSCGGAASKTPNLQSERTSCVCLSLSLLVCVCPSHYPGNHRKSFPDAAMTERRGHRG